MDKVGSATTSLLMKNQKNESLFPTLSWKERAVGFMVCFSLGFLIDLLSFGSIIGLFGDPSKFAITYSLGVIVALMGTSFLIGPTRQIKSMGQPTRIVTSSIFLTSIVGTLVSALIIHENILTFVCIIIEFTSFFWYCLSYIPYGRQCFVMFFKKSAQTLA